MPEPSPYVGSAACVPCHREESRSYDGTRHTRTFYHGAGLLDLPLPDRPVADPDDPKVIHTVERKGDAHRGVERRSTTRSRGWSSSMPSARPQHYLTMIARDEDEERTAPCGSRIITRPSGSGWGPTAGDVGHSELAEDRRGQRIDVRDGVVRCLYCHVTRSRDFRDPPPAGGPGPAAADRGIGCERCHGPGGNHLRRSPGTSRTRKASSDFAIVNVAGTPAATANGQCAECHTVGLPSRSSGRPRTPATSARRA